MQKKKKNIRSSDDRIEWILLEEQANKIKIRKESNINSVNQQNPMMKKGEIGIFLSITTLFANALNS
jgi:uncharacterized protein (UPF0276 family)